MNNITERDPYIYKGKCFDCDWHTRRYNNEGTVQTRRVDHEYEHDHTTWCDEIPVLTQYYE